MLVACSDADRYDPLPLRPREFFVILRRMREQGKTVIIITHKLSEVLAISDEVTVMRDGKVVKRVMPDDQQSLVELYTNEAVEFIGRSKGKPFSTRVRQ